MNEPEEEFWVNKVVNGHDDEFPKNTVMTGPKNDHLQTTQK